jgi:transcriptional regulator with XRE-family HTH domain
MKIGKRLKAEIKKQNLTAQQFAMLAGVSVDTVYKYYTMNNVDNDKIEKWSEILKISANDFMKDINLNSEPLSATLPLLPISAHGGSINYFLLAKKNCEFVTSPICEADCAITVTGDSMAPEYPCGSQLIIKKIDAASFLEWGKVYVLDTRNGIVIRRILKCADANHVLCVSINPDPAFASFEIPISDILGFYRIMMMMAIK